MLKNLALPSVIIGAFPIQMPLVCSDASLFKKTNGHMRSKQSSCLWLSHARNHDSWSHSSFGLNIPFRGPGHCSCCRVVQRAGECQRNPVGGGDERGIWRGGVAAGDALLGLAQQGAGDEVRIAQLGGCARKPMAHAMQGHPLSFARWRCAPTSSAGQPGDRLSMSLETRSRRPWPFQV